MHSVETNSTTQARPNISRVGLRVGSTKRKAATLRGALILAALSATLLIAARPAQAQTEAVLYSFSGEPDGANPNSKVVFNNGDLYGTTPNGGLGYGTVYQLAPNGSGGWTETVIYSFCSLASCADGEDPSYSYVIFDSKGNLYGTTYSGGTNGDGAVFELTPNGSGGWTESVLYSFCSVTNCADGENPVSGLVMDSSGNLYGTTWTGGVDTGTLNGAVFELSPPSVSGNPWTEQVIYDISSTYAGLTINGADIFGPAFGSIFELSPNGSGGWTSKVIFTFNSADASTEGSNPNGALSFDSAGNIYGTTYAGGADKDGLVYKLTLGTNGKYTRSTLYTFDNEGTNPLGGVVLDASGNLYGTTFTGGAHADGNVYELVAPTGGSKSYTHKVLFPFQYESGNEPEASLVLSGGYLYGTTYIGGTNGVGEVFEVNPAATATTTALTSSPNPSTNGTSVTFTATVTPAPPNGEMVVFEPIGQAPLVSGVATYDYSALTTGSHKITAVYEGDLNYIRSTSNVVTQVVTK
jgi:uncharacterized repeat protein (TIGR03803 family)